jgi:DNA-binding NtrC family response regulator
MSKRILIVDDERAMVRTLSDLLRIHGWECVGAHTGEDAVAAVRREAFTLVLMDIRMPGLSGVEALIQIRQLRPQQRVILMTAYTAGELITQALDNGAMRVLPKPVMVPELMEYIEQVHAEVCPILLVDDDPAFLKTISDVLRMRGQVVVEADSLDRAVEAMAENRPCVVALDLRIGEEQPMKSILAIREINPSVTLILFSGYPNLLDETMNELPSHWIYARIEKPFPPDLLLDILDEIG